MSAVPVMPEARLSMAVAALILPCFTFVASWTVPMMIPAGLYSSPLFAILMGVFLKGMTPSTNSLLTAFSFESLLSIVARELASRNVCFHAC